MKLSIVALIGTSLPVITEFIQYVEDGLNERVSDLTVISTSDPYVVSCADLAEQAVMDSIHTFISTGIGLVSKTLILRKGRVSSFSTQQGS